MPFVDEATAAQVTWKSSTPLLPEDARGPGPYVPDGPEYPVCLPWEFAAHNLLPEVRDVVLDRFRRDRITWHRGSDVGPTTHLRSSQIQCLNALGPFVETPSGLDRVLTHAGLDVGEILPFDDSGDHVVFEWIGLDDYLGERADGIGARGAHTTSIDAAVRYRTAAGTTAIALIEWKYTEQYRGNPLHGGETSMARRRSTYERWWSPDGPLRLDRISYDDLFVEPIYQLWRQQCLALEMERAHELNADLVTLVVAAPRANRGYWGAVPAHLADDYADVEELWRTQLRHPDRFAVLDTAQLVAPDSPLPPSFRERYGHMQELATADPTDEVLAGSVEQLVGAAQYAKMVGLRVWGDGGVVEQLIEGSGNLDRVSRVDRAALTRQLEEVAELTRRLRAEPIYEALRAMHMLR